MTINLKYVGLVIVILAIVGAYFYFDRPLGVPEETQEVTLKDPDGVLTKTLVVVSAISGDPELSQDWNKKLLQSNLTRAGIIIPIDDGQDYWISVGANKTLKEYAEQEGQYAGYIRASELEKLLSNQDTESSSVGN